MAQKEKCRGGSRPGAGRKPNTTPKRIPINIRLSVEASDNLKRAANYTGKSRQQLINDWAEGLTIPVK